LFECIDILLVSLNVVTCYLLIFIKRKYVTCLNVLTYCLSD